MKNLGYTIGSMLVITLVGKVLYYFGNAHSNIILLYVLGTVVISRYTTHRRWGLLSSVLSVLLFNYFFVEPVYSLAIASKEYLLTLLVMFVVSAITTTLTERVKQEVILSQRKEKYTKQLYEMSKELLKAQNLEQSKIAIAVNVAELFDCNVIIYTAEMVDQPFIYWKHADGREEEVLGEEERALAKKAFLSKGKVYSTKQHISYIPIIGHEQVLGVVGMSGVTLGMLEATQKDFLNLVIALAGMVLAREESIAKQQKLQLTVEGEQLKNNMLRAISHDIKTPLTGIIGAASTLIKDKKVMEEDTQQKLLGGIYDDGLWLLHSIENMLNFTRLEDGRLVVHKHMEVVEEIIETVLEKINRRQYSQKIQVQMPEEVLLMEVDVFLIVQVLYNLLDNAIKYTPDESVIELAVFEAKHKVYFEVRDRGNGITEEDRLLIFNKFYRVKQRKEAERSGVGLGLSICKGIVEAHRGEICTFNNSYGGATFQFSLPMEEAADEL
ncbi:MAG: sensor histidine kinase [Cellulosilyticaceae bacterium]